MALGHELKRCDSISQHCWGNGDPKDKTVSPCFFYDNPFQLYQSDGGYQVFHKL